MEEVTSKIIKGGALLDDSRRFVELWDAARTADCNLSDFRARNLLGKRSRKRAEDAVAILRQRLVDPGPELIAAMRTLTMYAEPFREACYYEAARNDPLLAYVAGVTLYDFDRRGRVKVTVDDVERALLDDPPGDAVRAWGAATRRRVIHGLLSALRDFGILEGAAVKHIAAPRLSVPAFVYVLGRLREQGETSYAIVSSPVWRWWLLDERQVRGLLLEADREGILQFSDAGSTVRIDWRIDGLEEMVRAVA